MNLRTLGALEAACLVPLKALWLTSTLAQAHSAAAMGATGSHDMKASMMTGMDRMQKMPMSGDR